jgi:hypothetical protein
MCESSVENQGSNTERCQDHFNNDDNTKTSMYATSGKRLNTAGLLCNDQGSLENSFNKSDNTIADETNSGDSMLENVCDVTLSVYPHRTSLKNMPGHGGNRTFGILAPLESTCMQKPSPC